MTGKNGNIRKNAILWVRYVVIAFFVFTGNLSAATSDTLPPDKSAYNYITMFLVRYTDRHQYTTEHFRITYSTTVSNDSSWVDTTDTNSNSVPDFVEGIGEELESAWENYESRGFTMPPMYASRYEVFLSKHAGSGITAATTDGQGVVSPMGLLSPQISGGGTKQQYSCMVLPVKFGQPKLQADYVNNQWVSVERTPEEVKRFRKVVIFHEFYHAVQYANASFDVAGNEWYLEATAQYSQTEHFGIGYDEVKSGTSYLWNLDARFDQSFVGAVPDSTYWDGGTMYGRWMFFDYQASRHKGDYLLDLLAAVAKTGDAFTGIDSIARKSGSTLIAQMNDFATTTVGLDSSSWLEEFRAENSETQNAEFEWIYGAGKKVSGAILRDTIDCSTMDSTWDSYTSGRKVYFKNMHLRGYGVDVIELKKGSPVDITLKPNGLVTNGIHFRLVVRRNDTLAVYDREQAFDSAPLTVTVPGEFDRAWLQVSHTNAASGMVDPDCRYTLDLASAEEPDLSKASRVRTASTSSSIQSAKSVTRKAEMRAMYQSGSLMLNTMPLENALVEIFDVSGRLLATYTKANAFSSATIRIPHIASGICIVRVTTQSGVSSLRTIIK